MTTQILARRRLGVWPAAFGGLAALLIGNGIGRFAYGPLIPALVGAGWFSPADAAYLAATNLAGYLLGALGAARLGWLIGNRRALRLAALATTLSLAACAWPLGFAWYTAWRLLAGVMGGVLMVLAVPAVLAVTPAALRGRAAGVIITGIGLGIAASGTIVPLVAQSGVAAAWLALAAVALVLSAYLWLAIPGDAAVAAPVATGGGVFRPAIALLLAAYACDAFGFVPHTVFWVDFIARGLDLGLEFGGFHWVVFGLGAALGPFLVGSVADRTGIGRCFVGVMALKAAAVALPLASTGTFALLLSSAVVGALSGGTAALCSAWVAAQVGVAHHRRVWGWMTTSFGVAQAGGAWALSHLFAVAGSYSLLFAAGAVALAAGALCALGALRLERAPLSA